MNSFIIYSIEVIIASVVLVGFYFMFFKDLTLFRFNRFYLLASMALPFILPLMQMPIETSTGLPNVSLILDEVIVGADQTNVIQAASHLFLLKWGYSACVLILLVRIIVGVLSIISLFKKSKKTKLNGVSVYLCTQEVNPFSVFKRIVVGEHMVNDSMAIQRILLHEQTHIKQHHGIDCFVAEIICALFWFNPMFWWLKKELKSTHEYLADEKVLEQDFDLSEYFMLMLNNIVGKNVGLANNLNQSLNLKRMKMMKKKRTSSFAKVMSISALPFVFMLASVLCNQTVSAQKKAPMKFDVDELVVVGHANTEAKAESRSFRIVEAGPSYPGGSAGLNAYLRQNVKYPAEAISSGAEARVNVTFIVSKKGKVKNVVVDKSVNKLLRDEAIRVVKSMPNWKPGIHEGKPASAEITIPINFVMR